jgi:hypothetical protein
MLMNCKSILPVTRARIAVSDRGTSPGHCRAVLVLAEKAKTTTSANSDFLEFHPKIRSSLHVASLHYKLKLIHIPYNEENCRTICGRGVSSDKVGAVEIPIYRGGDTYQRSRRPNSSSLATQICAGTPHNPTQPAAMRACPAIPAARARVRRVAFNHSGHRCDTGDSEGDVHRQRARARDSRRRHTTVQ